MNNLLLKRTPSSSYDKRFNDVYDQMLAQHHLNMTGKYDYSGLDEQDRILFHNTFAVNSGTGQGRKGDLQDTNYRSIPRGTYVPLHHIKQSREMGDNQHFVDNPITYGIGGNKWAHPSSPGAFHISEREESDMESQTEALEGRENMKRLFESLNVPEMGKERPAVRDSETDPLGIDKAFTSCDCDSCNLLAKAVIGREKKPSPDAQKGKHSCGSCNGQGKTPKCESCGYQKTPYGTLRATKPSQWKNRTFKKSESLLAEALLKGKKKSKPFHGYNPNRHSRKGGLNAKGRAKFKRETGANLKPPVSTPPSKLKPGSKKAKRRKSFCARMGGVKGPTSKGGKLTPKGAALKRWNC